MGKTGAEEYEAGEQGQDDRWSNGENCSGTFGIQPSEAEGKAGAQEAYTRNKAVFLEHHHGNQQEEQRPRGSPGARAEDEAAESEIEHKHRTNKNKFSPDTPPQVKYLHSKFRQVFQPFQKNSDKYSETHQLKTGNRANAG